jgi:hypothetical protein
MTRLEIILIAVSTLSIFVNVFLFIYTRAILSRLLFISEELGDLQDMTDSFAKHLHSVYEMETFYGDQTLESLLKHAVSYNEQLETFEWIYSLTEEKEQFINDDNTDPQETEETLEEA